MIIDTLVQTSIVLNIIALVGITYLMCKMRELERMIYNIPDPYAVFDEKIKSKIPMIIGPDGKPTPLTGMPQTESTHPTYVG